MGNCTGRADRQVLPPPTEAEPSWPQEEDPVRFVNKFFNNFLGYLRKKFQERARGLHRGSPSPLWPIVDLPEPDPGTDRHEPVEDPVFLALLQYLIETSFEKGLGYPLSRDLAGLFHYALCGDIMELEALCSVKKHDDPITATKILAVGRKLIYLGQKFRAAGIKWKCGIGLDREDDDSIRPACYADDGGRLDRVNTEERLIGEDAQKQAFVNPEGTIFNVKRLIGRTFEDNDVQKDMKLVPYEIVDKDGKPYIKVKMGRGERSDIFSPEDVVALILAKIKEDAERTLQTTIVDAIVTVPAYFNVDQRRATRDACNKARLNLVRIINEPTAAAIAYGRYKQDSQKNILVCHLGGGTFDVSILIIDNGAFVVLATSGDKLGGEDFDKTIMQHFIKLINKKHGKDVSGDNRALVKLRRECERAKRALGCQQEVKMEIESLCEDFDFSELLTRDLFEELNDDLFVKIVWHVNKTMKDAGLEKDQIDEVVLTGGSSRIPKIQQLLRDYFNGKEPNTKMNLDEAARDGAAIIGGILCGNGWDDTKDILILDVAPPTTGTEAMNTLIHRNIMIPSVESQIFTTYQARITGIPSIWTSHGRTGAHDNQY